MKQPVLIKGTKSGIIVHLSNSLPFDELLDKVKEKFIQSRTFLGNSQIALSFEGRKITDSQQLRLVDCISENSDLEIVCVIDEDKVREAYLSKTLEEHLMSLNCNTGQFYKGSIRSGQVLEFDSSIIILGDVHAGAQVISTGNVIILGKLLGNAFAGASGKNDAFVIALSMNPTQIRIGDCFGRRPATNPPIDTNTKIAFLLNGHIYIDSLWNKANKDLAI